VNILDTIGIVGTSTAGHGHDREAVSVFPHRKGFTTPQRSIKIVPSAG
jgi:hypothetical protein